MPLCVILYVIWLWGIFGPACVAAFGAPFGVTFGVSLGAAFGAAFRATVGPTFWGNNAGQHFRAKFWGNTLG